MHVFTMFDIGVSMISVSLNEHKISWKCNPVLDFFTIDNCGNEKPKSNSFSSISRCRYIVSILMYRY